MVALREGFLERYPEDPLSMFLSTGSKFFNDKLVYTRYRELANYEPYTKSEDGLTIIFKRRIKGRRYVIGADTARGIQVTTSDTDFSAAKVLDLDTGEEVAAFHGRVAPEIFGVILAELGRMYNDALICVERNGDGYTVLLTLSQEEYGSVYRHRAYEDRAKKTVVELPGWPNTMVTRPIACNRLKQYFGEYPENFYDVLLLNEMFSFSRNGKNGRPEAMQGSHDDAVFASSIAHYCRLVELGFIDPLFQESENYGDTTEAA